MTIRRLMSLSTSITLIVLGLLLFLVWSGFQHTMESSREENTIALPALVAMLGTRFDVVQIQQYLTDVSATGETDGFKDAKAAYDSAIVNLNNVARLEPPQAEQVASVKDRLAKFHAIGVEMANAYGKSGREAGNALMKRPNDGFDAQAEQLTQQLESLEKAVRERMADSVHTAEEQIARAQYTSLLLGLAVGFLMIGSGFATYRVLIRLLGCEPGFAAEIAQRIASGDLSQEVNVPSGDHKSLLAAIRDMQEGLRMIISGIGNSTGALMDSARDISHAASEVSKAVHFQIDKAASMAASIEQMAVSISHITDSAGGAYQSAVDTRGLSDIGGAAVAEAIAEMDSISTAVMRTAESLKSLGERSEQIVKIVYVIREIADQTNLLALNAAIEAARAGEQGRGFAVVADEVRKLAERTASATTEIKETVESVRDGTVEAVEEMSNGSARVLAGVTLIRQAGESMTRIQEGVGQVMRLAEEISASLRQQDVANHDIARNVEGIAQMTEETGRVVQSVSESADKLEKLSVSMGESVHKFRL